MTPENNEYRKRQQQRAAARQRRQAARRRMMIRLGLAALVLIACGLVIWLVSVEQDNTAANQPAVSATTPGPNPAQTTPESTEAAVREEKTVIRVAAAGDLNINDATVASGKTANGYDYSRVFLDVMPLLTNADLTVLNLEGNLCGAPYGSDTASAPQEMMTALADAGVDLVQMANSYSITNGLLGLSSTLDGIRAAGMEPLGAYASNEEFRQSQGFTIREVNGVRLAFVAFTKGMNNLGLPAGSEDCVNVLYEDYATTYQDVDQDKINDILDAVEEAEPDYVIALVHWGSEYNDEPSDTQTVIRDLLLERGVDAILGTHPHLVHAVEYDREAGTFVAYSLGDFFSSTERAGTNYSVILNLEITRDNRTGETKLTKYTCTPIYNMTPEESGEEGLRLVRLMSTMEQYDNQLFNRVTKELYDSMGYAMQRVESRINGNG